MFNTVCVTWSHLSDQHPFYGLASEGAATCSYLGSLCLFHHVRSKMRAGTTPSLSTTWGILGEDIKSQLQESFFTEQIRLKHPGMFLCCGMLVNLGSRSERFLLLLISQSANTSDAF